jgi:hypothetical protein
MFNLPGIDDGVDGTGRPLLISLKWSSQAEGGLNTKVGANLPGGTHRGVSMTGG